MDKKKIVKISIVIVSILLFYALAKLSQLSREALLEMKNNLVNIEQENITGEPEVQITSDYITSYYWNTQDIKTFNNTYYVDLGIEDTPIVQNYIMLKVEIEKGDLEEGKYTFKTNNVTGVSFVIYIVDKPIEDLNKYEGDYISIFNNITEEAELKKGQYVYIIQGYNGKGSMYLIKNTRDQ